MFFFAFFFLRFFSFDCLSQLVAERRQFLRYGDTVLIKLLGSPSKFLIQEGDYFEWSTEKPQNNIGNFRITTDDKKKIGKYLTYFDCIFASL
jgi:hypothetical protein